jgi:hypothetical protein
MDSSTTGSVLYFGFYDLNASYKSLVFANNDLGDFIGVDDVSVGSRVQVVPSAVPEPGLWVVMITGFGLVGWTLREARRRPGVPQTFPWLRCQRPATTQTKPAGRPPRLARR